MADNGAGSGGASRIKRFLGNPLVGGIGLIVGIISVGLNVIFYFDSQQAPELTYLVHPTKAAVVRRGETSRLTVEFDGKEQKGNITAAQVAFWNDGDKPIRKSDLRRPLVIKTGSDNAILEVKLRKQSRDVVTLNIDRSNISQGEATVSWDILEKDDGGVLQIIYTGDETVEITADATVVGQTHIAKSSSMADRQTIRLVMLGLVLMVALAGSAVALTDLREIFRERERRRHFLTVIGSSLVLGLIGGGIATFLGFISTPPEPPFGF